MSERTGDGQDGREPGPQVIRLGTVSGAGSPQGSGPAASPPVERDPFAPSRFRPTRRRVIALALVAAVAVGAWTGYERGSQWWEQRTATKQVAAHDAAVSAAAPMLADLRFPGSVEPDANGTLCALRGAVCGATDAPPAEALTEIAPTLTALGFVLVDDARRDECEAQGQRFERCSRGVLLDGVQIGTLSITRDNFQVQTFGSRTEVALRVSVPTDASDGDVGPPVAVPVVSPWKLDLLAADLAELARCTKPSEDGCLAYEVRTTLPGPTRENFARVGRLAVTRDWAASGYCPGGVNGHCDLFVSRRTGTTLVDRIGLLGTFDPSPGGTRVVLTIDATRESVG